MSGAVFQHQRGDGMTEQVAGPHLADLGPGDIAARHEGQMIATDGHFVCRQEQRGVIGLERQRGPRLAEIFLYPGNGAVADEDHPIFLALALADRNDAALQIKIEQLQVDQFQPPHPVE